MEFDIDTFKKNIKFCIWLDYAQTGSARRSFESLRKFIASTPEEIRVENYVHYLIESYTFGETFHYSWDSMEPARKANEQLRQAISSLDDYDNIFLLKFAEEANNALNKVHKSMDRFAAKFVAQKNKIPSKAFRSIVLHGLIGAKGNWETFDALRDLFNKELPHWAKEQKIVTKYKPYSAGSSKDKKHSWARSLKSQLYRKLEIESITDYESSTLNKINSYDKYYQIQYDKLFDVAFKKYVEK